MLLLPKYDKYEDWNPKPILRAGIEDMTPYEVEMPTPPPLEEFVNFGLFCSELVFVVVYPHGHIKVVAFFALDYS